MNRVFLKNIVVFAAILLLFGTLSGCANKNVKTHSAHSVLNNNQYYPYLASLIYLNEGKIDLATKKAIESANIVQTPEILVYLVKLKFLTDRFAAKNIALYAYKKYPKNKNIVSMLLTDNMPLSINKKIKIAKRYLKYKPDDKIKIILAKLYAAKHQRSKAISILSGIKSSDPDILSSEGIVYFSIGMKTEGRRLFKRAYRLGSSNIRVKLFMARIKEEKGDLVGAAKIYIKVAEHQPDNTALLYRIARDLDKSGRDFEAISYYNRVISLGGLLKKKAQLAAALIFLRNERYDKAAKLFDELLKNNPENYDIRYRLALAEKGAGRLISAYRLFSRIDIKSDLYVDAVVNMAEIKATLNKNKDGLYLINNALKLKQNNKKLEMAKAVLLNSLKRYDEAVRLYLKLAKYEKNSDYKENLYIRAADTEYEKMHNLKKTISILKDLIKKSPKSPEALNFLGYVYIDNNINVKKGIRLVKRALKIYPGWFFYLDSLGWGYYKLGKYKKALDILKKAARFRYGDPVIFKHLGYAYAKLKKYDLARKFLLKSYHLKDDPSVYKKLLLIRKFINKAKPLKHR